MKYFISDIHFGHKNILEYSSRPFSSLQEMESKIISNWNNKISEKDTVYFLGDFSFLNKEESKSIVNKLNGYKIIILGNHDRNAKAMIEIGFNEAYHNLKINIKDREVLLSHYPYLDGDFVELARKRPNILEIDKNAKDVVLPEELSYDNCKSFLLYKFNKKIRVNDKNFNQVKRIISRMIGTKLENEGLPLLHGHTHSPVKRQANMINLSVEAWDYTPASEDEIYELILDYEKELTGQNINLNNFKDNNWRIYSSNRLVSKFKVIKEILETYYSLDYDSFIVPKNYSQEWYDLNVKLKRFIPKKDLIKNSFYKGHCRNASWAYWDGEKFTYIRNKFGSSFKEDIECIENDMGYDVFIPQSVYELSEEEKKKWEKYE